MQSLPQWPPWFDRLRATFQQFFEEERFCDVLLACRGGKVRAHRLVLSLLSPFLKGVLDASDEELTTLYLLDVAHKDMKIFMHCMYTGVLPADRQSLSIVQDMCHLFALPSVLAEVDAGNKITDKESLKGQSFSEQNEGESVEERSVSLSDPDQGWRNSSTGKKNALIDKCQTGVSLHTCLLCPLCNQYTHDRASVDDTSQSTSLTGSQDRCHCFAAKLPANKFVNHVKKQIPSENQGEQRGKDFLVHHALAKGSTADQEGSKKFVSRCPSCPYEARTAHNLASHNREMHHGTSRSLQKLEMSELVACPNCRKEFKKWYYLQYHKKMCFSGKLARRCNICNAEGFASATNLKNHMRAKHSQERPFACEYCPSRYATSMALSSHRKSKHQVNASGQSELKQVHQCQQCGKLLSKSSKLMHHIKVVHNKVKEFKCSYCDKRFSSAFNKRLHEGNNHQGIKEQAS